MKIRPVGVELFHSERHTDRRTDEGTDMKKLIVTFRNTANAPQNWSVETCVCVCAGGRVYVRVRIVYMCYCCHNN